MYHLFLSIKNNSITSVNECCVSNETFKDSSKETVETHDQNSTLSTKGSKPDQIVPDNSCKAFCESNSIDNKNDRNNDSTDRLSSSRFNDWESVSSSSSDGNNLDSSSASSDEHFAIDDNLSDCDKGDELTDRFDVDEIDERVRPLIDCINKVTLGDTGCPLMIGKNMTELEVNCLLMMFDRIMMKRGRSRLRICTENMLYLDIGSGKGLPQFMFWYLYKIPSHGIEISPWYTKVALLSLLELRKMNAPEDVRVSFSCMDVHKITSLHPYTFINANCTGYVYEIIR